MTDQSSAGAPRRANPVLAVSRVRTAMGGRILVGPLVIREEGLYFFIERTEPRPTPAQERFEWIARHLAGPAARVLLAAVMPSGDAGLPEGVRPKDEFAHLCEPALRDAPDLLHAGYCLVVEKAKVVSATFRGASRVDVEVTGDIFDARGDFAERRVREFMAWRGYEVRQGLTGARRRLLLSAAVTFGMLYLGSGGLTDNRAMAANPVIKALAAAGVTPGQLAAAILAAVFAWRWLVAED